MKKHLLIIVMLLCPPFFFATILAQNNQHQCFSHEVLAQQLAANPTMKARVEANERFIAEFTNRAQTRGGKQIIIPTVVHVVSSSVTDAQVLSQIDALNRDFNRLNSDISKVPADFTKLAADCEIKFQLATRTPENNATNGIIRHTSSRTEWGGKDDVKKPSRGGFAPWNASKYLNIYVCPIGNGVLGYASFPGTPAELDGVVIDPIAFGTKGVARRPFNIGRTCVHEVAHWLNLYHIWGDSSCGDDHCSDTPTQKEAHYGDIVNATFSNCKGTQTRDMSMNFMDYVNDASMVMFTNGQKTRMQAILNGERASILTSDGCVSPVQTDCVVKNINISELKTTAATLSWAPISGTKTYTIDIKKTGATGWESMTSNAPSFTFSNLTANESYTMRAKSDCPTAEYSELVSVKLRPVVEGSFQIYPNPVVDAANFFFETNKDSKVVLTISDANGKVQFQTTKNIGKETPSVSVDVSALSSGFYIVTAEQNGLTISRKLVKN
jgi:Pregnancy-associated plasma protein-A/Secretion system C-terminal sorting domain